MKNLINDLRVKSFNPKIEIIFSLYNRGLMPMDEALSKIAQIMHDDYMKKPYRLLYIYDGLDEKSFTLYETGDIDELESEILAQEYGNGNNISEQHNVIDTWDYHDSFDDFDELVQEYRTTADKVIGAYFGSVNG